MIMASLSSELHDAIVDYLAKIDGLIRSPTMTRKSRGKYSVYSGNYFFKDSTRIPVTMNEVSVVIENAIKAHVNSRGELIKSIVGSGEIWDSGKRYFEVKGGFHFEVYCYDCRSLTFIRLAHEKTLYYPASEWLSIDIDEDQDTVWLEETGTGSA